MNLSVSNKEKRGILKPLMSEEVKAAAKVEDLAYDCRIMRFFQYLTEDADYKEFVISKQILRSRTTIGANRMRQSILSQMLTSCPNLLSL